MWEAYFSGKFVETQFLWGLLLLGLLLYEVAYLLANTVPVGHGVCATVDEARLVELLVVADGEDALLFRCDAAARGSAPGPSGSIARPWGRSVSSTARSSSTA